MKHRLTPQVIGDIVCINILEQHLHVVTGGHLHEETEDATASVAGVPACAHVTKHVHAKKAVNHHPFGGLPVYLLTSILACVRTSSMGRTMAQIILKTADITPPGGDGHLRALGI